MGKNGVRDEEDEMRNLDGKKMAPIQGCKRGRRETRQEGVGGGGTKGNTETARSWGGML